MFSFPHACHFFVMKCLRTSFSLSQKNAVWCDLCILKLNMQLSSQLLHSKMAAPGGIFVQTDSTCYIYFYT